MTTSNTVIAINQTHGQDILTASLTTGGMDLAETLDALHDTAAQALALVTASTTVTGGLALILETYPTAEYFHIFHDGEWCFLDRADIAEMI